MPPTSKPSLRLLKTLLAAKGKCPCFHWRSRPPPGHMGLPWIWKVGQASLPPCRGPADHSQDHPLFWTLCSDLLRPTQVPREPVANADLHLPLLLPGLASGVGRFLNLVPSDPDPHTLSCVGGPVVRCHFRNYVQLYTEGDSAGDSTFIVGALQKQRMFSAHHRGGTRDLKQKGDLFLPPGPKGEPHLAEHLILAL